MSRSPSIPERAVPMVVSLSQAGYGSRRIAKMMERHKIWTTKSSVHRLLTGQPPYEDIHETPCPHFEAGKP